jgi:hypothetical protein
LNHTFDSKKRIFIELWEKQGTKHFEPHIWFKETYLHWALCKREYKTFWTTHLIQRSVSSWSSGQNRVQNILNHTFESKKV